MPAVAKLTARLIKEVKRALGEVMYFSVVRRALGISKSSWHRWYRRGREEEQRLEHPRTKPIPAEALYRDFYFEVRRALARAEIADATAVKDASAKHWQAAAWRLERRFPSRWARAEPSNEDLDAVIRHTIKKAAREKGRQAAPGDSSKPT